MKSVKLRIIALGLVTLGFSSAAFSGAENRPLFFTPTQQQTDVLSGIKSAHKSIHMTMFRLTDQSIIDALVQAAGNGIEVKVILDKSSTEKEKPNGPSQQLAAGGVDVRKSSAAFSISHAKTFTVDGSLTYLMTLNLTRIADRVRDVGMITDNQDTVSFIEDLFAADWDNAANGTKNTPTVPENIVISPVDSTPKIRALIQSAKSTLQVVVENLSYDPSIMNTIIQDMIDAKNRGVTVQVMVPRCNIANSDFNLKAAQKLDSSGVNVRLMPDPESASLPYLHEKAIVVDGVRGFLGSENFSVNSLTAAREIGIIFDDVRQLKQLSDVFNEDFAKSLGYNDAVASPCSSSFGGGSGGSGSGSGPSSDAELL